MSRRVDVRVSVVHEHGARMWGNKAIGGAEAARGRPGRRCESGARARRDRAVEHLEHPVPGQSSQSSFLCKRVTGRARRPVPLLLICLSRGVSE